MPPGVIVRWVKFVKSLTSLGPRYVALWIGHTVSQFGTYVAFLTIPLLVLHIQNATQTSGTLDFSIAYAAETAPTLIVGLLGGVLLDRWQLRPVMVATDLIRASAFFYLAASVGDLSLFTVFVMALLVGSMTTLFDGALFALIPSLVPGHRLVDGNGYVAASQQANFALGPLAAGLLVVWTGDPALGMFLNGVTFVVSAIMLKWVGRVDHQRTPEDERASFLTEAANGIRYIWAEPRLRTTTIAAAVPNFVIGFVEATFVVLAFDVLGAVDEAQVGVLFFFLGVGGVVGALLAPRVSRRLGIGRTLILGITIAGTLLFAVMFTTFGPIAFVLQAAWMVGISFMNVALATVRQHYSVPSMLGRVVTASRALSWALLPVGALLGGWLGNTAESYRWVARAAPLIIVGVAIWLTTTIVWSNTFGPGFDESDVHLPGETAEA